MLFPNICLFEDSQKVKKRVTTGAIASNLML